MGSKKRSRKDPSKRARQLRRTFARNVEEAMKKTFRLSDYKTRSKQEKALAEAAGVEWATVQRILYQDRDAAVGASLDTIADIAAALEERVSDLFTQGYADKLATTYPQTAESEELQRSRD